MTLCNPIDCSPPGSSVHGILWAIILEWGAMPSLRGSSWHRDRTHVSCVSCIAGRFFTTEPPGKPINTYVCTHTHTHTHIYPHKHIYIKWSHFAVIVNQLYSQFFKIKEYIPEEMSRESEGGCIRHSPSWGPVSMTTDGILQPRFLQTTCHGPLLWPPGSQPIPESALRWPRI